MVFTDGSSFTIPGETESPINFYRYYNNDSYEDIMRRTYGSGLELGKEIDHFNMPSGNVITMDDIQDELDFYYDELKAKLSFDETSRKPKTTANERKQMKNEKKEVFTIQVEREDENGEFEVFDAMKYAKTYYSLDDAIEAGKEAYDEYSAIEDRPISVCIMGGEYEMPNGDIYGEPEGLEIIRAENRDKFDESTKRKPTMKKLNITKERFEKSRYFTKKYGNLEYVSESGKMFKTDKGKVLMFSESKKMAKESSVEVASPDNVQVDDILYCTSYYDFMISTFYKVLEKRGKSTLVLQRLKKNYTGSQSDGVAEPTDEIDSYCKPITVRYGKHGFKIGSNKLYVWDGTPLEEYNYSESRKFGKKFTKESSTDGIYGFYEWLKSNTMYDSGIHVRYHDNEDGTESLEMTFDDSFDWGDDVEDGKLPKEQSENYQHWLQMFKSKARENGWEFSKDYDDTYDEYVLILISVGSSEEYDESYGEYDDEDDGVGDGQWHVFDYGPDFPLIEQYMIMAPTGDTFPATSRGAICDYDGEYNYSTRQEMEDDVFALEVDGEKWTPTEIDQPYPREVQKAIRLVISRLEESDTIVEEP